LKPIVNYVAHVHAKDVIGRKAVTLGKGEYKRILEDIKAKWI